jgi:hypothetical protein
MVEMTIRGRVRESEKGNHDWGIDDAGDFLQVADLLTGIDNFLFTQGKDILGDGEQIEIIIRLPERQ